MRFTCAAISRLAEAFYLENFPGIVWEELEQQVVSIERNADLNSIVVWDAGTRLTGCGCCIYPISDATLKGLRTNTLSDGITLTPI